MRVKICLYGLLLCAALCAAAPPPSGAEQEYAKYLVPRDAVAASTAPLSRAAAVSDLVFLEGLFKEAYSGYDYFGEHGTDWEHVFAQARKELNVRKEWPAVEYFSFLVERLRAAGLRDNHLSLKLELPDGRLWEAPYSAHWTPRFADGKVIRKGGRLFLDDGSELLKVRGGPPEAFLFPSWQAGPPVEVFLLGSYAREPLRALDCEVRPGTGPVTAVSLPLHPLKNVRQPQTPIFESREIDGIPYIALRSLQNAEAAALGRFVLTAEEMRSSPAVILDLRGNAGGSDGWGNRWLSGLTSGTIRPVRDVKVLVSPATLQGEVNYLEESLAEAGDYAARDRITGLLTAAAEKMATAKKAGTRRHWETKHFEWRGTAPAEFGGTLVVLSDAWNASAGESFLETLRTLGGHVVTLGGNSMGVNTFGPLFSYRLPASGIKVYLPQGITLFREGLMYEAGGVPPDIWIDEPDALPAAIEYAKRITRAPAR